MIGLLNEAAIASDIVHAMNRKAVVAKGAPELFDYLDNLPGAAVTQNWPGWEFIGFGASRVALLYGSIVYKVEYFSKWNQCHKEYETYLRYKDVLPVKMCDREVNVTPMDIFELGYNVTAMPYMGTEMCYDYNFVDALNDYFGLNDLHEDNLRVLNDIIWLIDLGR